MTILFACKRDDYYKDGGKATADFDGSMLQYLESKPVKFDTIAQLVKLAGLEEEFSKEDFTFFAPDDKVIKEAIGNIRTIGSLNEYLFFRGRDTLKSLNQIDATIWKKYLQRYMFNGVNRLKDYPQIDFNLRSIYPGALYYSFGNTLTNIGVVYNDENGVRYIGYRQLTVTFVPDASRPEENRRLSYVASSDIKPKNGIVHALAPNGDGGFGFNRYEFFSDVYNRGLKNN